MTQGTVDRKKDNLSASVVVIEYQYFAGQVFRVYLGEAQFLLHYWVTLVS